jgi:hypothetical protein
VREGERMRIKINELTVFVKREMQKIKFYSFETAS